jgi:Acyl-CoA dehydrogenase, C-terminal domain
LATPKHRGCRPSGGVPNHGYRKPESRAVRPLRRVPLSRRVGRPDRRIGDAPIYEVDLRAGSIAETRDGSGVRRRARSRRGYPAHSGEARRCRRDAPCKGRIAQFGLRDPRATSARPHLCVAVDVAPRPPGNRDGPGDVASGHCTRAVELATDRSSHQRSSIGSSNQSLHDLPRPSLLPALQLLGRGGTGTLNRRTYPYRLDTKDLVRRYKVIYTIFEGTSEIQRLIIARAISGVHIK